MNGNAEKATDRERMGALQKMEQMVNYVPVESIKEHLEVTRQGTIKGTMQNYMIVLKEDPLL